MKLQIIVLHYNEPSGYVERFLDSIKMQDYIDKNDIEVVIVNDGDKLLLPDDLFKKYSFSVKYLIKDWGGLSDSRQYGQDYCTANYIMFCDCDDMFLRIDSLYKILEQINQNRYDLIVGARLQDVFHKIEAVDCKQQLQKHEIHAKVYKRQFLLDHNIKWKTEITAWDEDFYFNKLVLSENPNIGFIVEPIYLWKIRDGSLTSDHGRSREEIIYREITLVKRYLILLAELKKRNKLEYFNKMLVNVMMLIYDTNLTYKNYENIYTESIKLAKDLLNLYKTEITALKQDNIMAGFKQLDHNFVLVYNCFEKTFAQWWRELDSDLKNWLL